MLTRKYQHILFDLDGTIFDTYEANLRSFEDMLKKWGRSEGFKKEDFDPLFGIPGMDCLKAFGFSDAERPQAMSDWVNYLFDYADTVKLFPTMLSVLDCLIKEGFTLGIVTSRRRQVENPRFKGTLGDALPPVIAPYFTHVICSDDVARPKPYPDSILRYLEITGAKREEVLFVGDAATDLACADSAGIDFGLALWGAKLAHHVRCAHYFKCPYEVLQAVLRRADDPHERLYRWASEIQALGQIGITYSRNIFDTERYQRMRDLAVEMMVCAVGVDELKIKQSFAFDKGYITPKMDTRAAIFNDQGEILMVRERMSGLWNIPGGWCDEHETLVSNTVKEVREEAGLTVNVSRLIAVIDRNRHNTPPLPYGALKAFLLCSKEEEDAPFEPTDETLERAWFAEDKLPVDKLRLDTNTLDQIKMCFDAYRHQENWVTVTE